MLQERIDTLLSRKGQLLSVEFFPPKSDDAIEALVASAAELGACEPDFVSVTYGAGGSTRDRSARVSSAIREELQLSVMPHLTCVGASRDELSATLGEIHAQGYRNIMALRGDPPKASTEFVVSPDGLAHGSDLVSLIRELHPDICIGVAGYPEKHPEAPDLSTDLERLRVKVEAGASFITTQLFFDNEVFYRFRDKAADMGIDVPIFPGLMPVLSSKQIRRIASLCGSKLPKALEAELDKAGEDAATVRELGLRWAEDQLLDLQSMGVPGIHLYALNRSDAAGRLMRAFRNAEAASAS